MTLRKSQSLASSCFMAAVGAGGSRVAFSYQCDYFASRGMAAATVTYRLRTKEDRAALTGGQSTKRVCIPDVKSAIRWFKQHAKELGVDPNRIVAGGGSAGGHISLLGTTNPGLNDPNDPKGIDTSVAAYVLFNPALSKSDAKDPDVDFLRHLKAGFGPALVFFGSKDPWLKKGLDARSRKNEVARHHLRRDADCRRAKRTLFSTSSRGKILR